MAEMLTTNELAARWGITPSALQKWRKRGQGPAFTKIGDMHKSPVRYRLEDVIAYEHKNDCGTQEADHV